MPLAGSQTSVNTLCHATARGFRLVADYFALYSPMVGNLGPQTSWVKSQGLRIGQSFRDRGRLDNDWVVTGTLLVYPRDHPFFPCRQAISTFHCIPLEFYFSTIPSFPGQASLFDGENMTDHPLYGMCPALGIAENVLYDIHIRRSDKRDIILEHVQVIAHFLRTECEPITETLVPEWMYAVVRSLRNHDPSKAFTSNFTPSRSRSHSATSDKTGVEAEEEYIFEAFFETFIEDFETFIKHLQAVDGRENMLRQPSVMKAKRIINLLEYKERRGWADEVWNPHDNEI